MKAGCATRESGSDASCCQELLSAERIFAHVQE